MFSQNTGTFTLPSFKSDRKKKMHKIHLCCKAVMSLLTCIWYGGACSREKKKVYLKKIPHTEQNKKQTNQTPQDKAVPCDLDKLVTFGSVLSTI